MNILIVSLLRAGDLIMHSKAIEVLSESPFNIYILTNRQNKGVEFLIPWVKKIFYFDRELVQRSQKEDFLPFDSGYKHTIKLIDELNEIAFETIYNFTNTKISAILISRISAKNKIGLNYNDPHFFINDPKQWIKYLNSIETSKIHLIDIFKNSLIEASSPRLPSRNPDLLSVKKTKTICIQALTSDQKKNWPLKNWEQLVNLLTRTYPDYQICLLGSPSEQTILAQIFKNNLASIFICTYQEAYDKINSANLLITGDTSIKHLALFSDTPVLELTLGSAKPSETGVYSKNGYLLFNPLACQPCKHSSNCTDSLICHATITVEDVFNSANYILETPSIPPKSLYKTTIDQKFLVSYIPVTSFKSGITNKGTNYAERVQTSL